MNTIAFILSGSFLSWGFIVLCVVVVGIIVFFFLKDKNDKERILQEQKEKEVMQGQIGNLSTSLDTESDNISYLTKSMVKDKMATATNALSSVVSILNDLKNSGRLPIPAADAMILQIKSGIGSIAPTANMLLNALEEQKQSMAAKQKVLTASAAPAANENAEQPTAIETVTAVAKEEVKTA